MTKTWLALLVLSCVAARAEANPCCYGDGDDADTSWDIDIAIPVGVVVLAGAFVLADASIVVADLAYAGKGQRVPTGFAVFELLMAAPNVAIGLAGDETANHAFLALGAGMVTHAVLSMVWPRAETEVTVQPTTVGAKGYGVGLSGRF